MSAAVPREMSRTDQLKVAMVGRAAGGYDALVTRVLLPKRADHMVMGLRRETVGPPINRPGRT